MVSHAEAEAEPGSAFLNHRGGRGEALISPIVEITRAASRSAWGGGANLGGRGGVVDAVIVDW